MDTGHHTNQFALLGTRRFWPLFVTQAIGAFNDNAFRYALSILLIYDLGPRLGLDAALLNTVSAGLLILPFFVFSATAGQIADKFDKALLARRIKFIEIFIVALASFSLFTDQVWLQLLTVLLTGVQSAFFGPIKYSILPQHLERHELLGGNGLIEMGTFLSILLGTLFGSFAIQSDMGRHAVSVVMIGLAVIAYMSARQIPEAPPPQPDLKVNPNFAVETWRMIGIARERSDVFLAILGISWFWYLGVVFLTQIPLFTQSELGANETMASVIIAAFTVAIGMGSIVTNRLLKGEVSVKYVPVASILITIFIIDLYFATGNFSTSDASTPLGPVDILSRFSGWRVLIDLALIAFCAGLFAVPLYAVVQQRSPAQKRARVIAANNIINAIFMTTATIISVLLLKIGVSVRGLFLVTGLANAVAAFWICQLLPQELAAYVARRLFRLFYRVEIKGFENFTKAGRKALIIANHTSFLDGPLISAFLPERCHFAINTHVATRWWVKPAFQLFDLLPIDPANPMALKTLANGLKRGRKVVIFPEGRITRTGSLMKVYEGPGVIAHLAGAKILPIRIDGAQYTPFSLMKGKHRLRWFPKITLTFLPPVKPDAPANLKGTQLREYLADKLYDVMTSMMFRTSFADETLFQSLLNARTIHGRNHQILEDIQRTPLTYGRIVMGSFILGRRLAELTPAEKTVGVLLPTAAGCLITIFGLHASGRVPALLNYSTGAKNMLAACHTAEVKTIITSRRFVEAGNFADDIAVLEKEARIIWIEDVREKIGLPDKLYGLFAGLFPKSALTRLGYNGDAHAPAVILFTSGSEGTPKGVVLSHSNLQANRHQAAARIDFTPKDIVFNAMPMFHTFGLNAGTFLPVLAGVRTFLYPSPLHYKIVPEMAYDINATILFGTDTFLTGYARNAHPYDFYAVRFVVAGAERVRPETRQTWMDTFGLRILEGYGVTECSPVLAVNTPIHYRAGTVGRLLDGIEHRLDPVEGIEEGGRLIVKGPNIMLGYLRAETPGKIDPPAEGWYDTGDIVKIDEKAFVTILGRAKRFSKIAGEMVSLAAVEMKLQQAFPDFVHAVVAIPDQKKGEQLVLFTTDPALDRARVAQGMKAQDAQELMVPRIIVPVETMPILGTGKTDYVTLNKMAREGNGRMIALDDRDRACLEGAQGPAMQLAMRLVLRAAEILGARSLIPVTFAHIDACFYSGEAHVDFAQFLVDNGARLAIPAWTNNGVVSLANPDIRPEASDPQMVKGGRKLMQLYEQLGCKPVWTCAPYQLPGGPKFGDHIVAGESNAVSFYNSVIGARTNKYGDYLDVACALIGKAPKAGLHRDKDRRGDILIRTEHIPAEWKTENIFYHLLGHQAGKLAGQRIPVISGLPPQPTHDGLKALSAAAASAGGVELWHAIGVTPEAETEQAAFGDSVPERVIELTPELLAEARRDLTTAQDGPLDMVALGTPHFSLSEFERLMPLITGRRIKPGLAFYVSTSRYVRDLAAERGWIGELEKFGATVIADTCTYYSPAVRQCRGRIMTNAAKWAYYAPGMLGVEVAFGSLSECVDSAVAGDVRRDPKLWTNGLA